MVQKRGVFMKIRKWIYRNFSDIFKFHIQIPFISIRIDFLTFYYEMDAMYNLAFDINIFGFKFYFVWGESRRHKYWRKDNVR